MVDDRLRVEVRKSEGHDQVLIACTGPITSGTLFPLRDAIRETIAKTVILDLGEVPHMDSAGLGSLVQAHISYQRAGRRLILAAPNERTLALLQMTNVQALFPIFKTAREAEISIARSIQ
ncbi:MAG: STAS domain-containing protein [Candidatus Acidiferrales bacterium]